MIYLTAQPDRIKFYWQLKVQLENFREMGIDMSDVHVLVGNDIGKNSSEMLSLRNTGAKVFFYSYGKDYRYISSVRPHILKQHFAAYPELENEYIFYLDSDVIFNRIPDYSSLTLDGNNWYVSDVRGYLSAQYILGCADKQIFKDMCNIVGIDPRVVQMREGQSGGCQYILTGTTAEFWAKVEHDCTEIFDNFPTLWNAAEKKYNGHNQEKYEQYGPFLLQIWCADMWAVLWNAWLRGHDTIITPELEFGWAHWDAPAAEKVPLFHLAGIADDNVKNEFGPHFDKRAYAGNITPFDQDLSYVSEKSATYKYVQIIKRFSHANA